MRNFLILSLMLLQTFFVNAQMKGQGNGNGQGKGHGGGGQSQTSMTAFKIDNAIGVINYDIYEVFEKIKIESDTDMQQVANKISEYSKAINKIKLNNNKVLTEVDKLVTNAQKEAMENGNRESMRYVQAEANEQLKAIKEQVIVAEKNLNLEQKGILSEKQNKKWLKYQSSKKSALKPNQQTGSQRGGQRGMGSGGGGGRNY